MIYIANRSAISSSAASQVIGANSACAFGADAAQRRFQPRRRMHQLGVAVDLGAGKAGGKRVGRIAGNAFDAPAIDLGQQGAHIRAIMRADDADRFHAPFSVIADAMRQSSLRRHSGRASQGWGPEPDEHDVSQEGHWPSILVGAGVHGFRVRICDAPRNDRLWLAMTIRCAMIRLPSDRRTTCPTCWKRSRTASPG